MRYLLLALLPACGIAIDASEPLVYVAPLEGTWTLETDPNTELRVAVPGGQPRFDAQFDFTADLVTPGGTTSYDGSADEDTFTLFDPGTGAVLLTGSLLENTTLRLSDGRTFGKPFTPDLVGTWQDVNHPARFYVIDSQGASTAFGCARATVENDDDVEGELDVQFAGDEIPRWRVESQSLLAVRAPAFFVGYSAIRVKRIDGYLHLQRVDRIESCP